MHSVQAAIRLNSAVSAPVSRSRMAVHRPSFSRTAWGGNRELSRVVIGPPGPAPARACHYPEPRAHIYTNVLEHLLVTMPEWEGTKHIEQKMKYTPASEIYSAMRRNYHERPPQLSTLATKPPLQAIRARASAACKRRHALRLTGRCGLAWGRATGFAVLLLLARALLCDLVRELDDLGVLDGRLAVPRLLDERHGALERTPARAR